MIQKKSKNRALLAQFTVELSQDGKVYLENKSVNPEVFRKAMDEWNQEHHSASGLIDEVLASNISEQEAEQRTLEFIKQHVGKNESPLCGNTVWHDRKFLSLYMPELEDYFHYRCIDVSSVKELTKRWRPDINIQHAKKTAAHRAEADVYESINELRFYRDTIFAQSS